ncbi:Alpha-N-acetylgalactosaminidase precursor [Fusarium agapanthi]|uniref:Alpha-galactosidase n=1 Tax=Fusarium agapanthi TaxID=1803897 RepID=A0A9P5BE64_9HYPO|nr:Alpha-N-acetylgalactosaminidase precursor [Fusarium agapanthi]
MKSLPSILAVAAIPSLASGQSFQSTGTHTISRGFVDAGYRFFQIDCGWASRDTQRDPNTGALKIDSNGFPDGLKPLSDLARSKGMKWTMYSDAGEPMCDPQYPSPVLGSLGHEAVDAEFFKSLNTEYLKYDNCYADSTTNNTPKDPRTDFVTRFGTMWSVLQKVGIPGMLICQWGFPYSSSSGLEGPAAWTQSVSISFRLSDDTGEGWSNVYRISNQAIHIARRNLSGPGHIADADLLEVGNSGMTFDEQATHFALWAMLKSALMISTDITALSAQTEAVLQNKDLISINQDATVKPISLVHLQLSALGDQSADIKDLSTGQTTTGASSFSKQVNGHGSVALRLSNIKKTSSTANYKYTSLSTGSLSSGAQTAFCSGCTSSTKVGNLGGSSNGQGFGGSTNERLASIKVSGGTAQTVSFPLTGYNWDKDVYKGYAVELSGFSTSGPNTITISGVNGGWAPDFDRLAVMA